MVAYSKPIKVMAYSCPLCKQKVYMRDAADRHTCFCCSISCRGEITEIGKEKGVTEISREEVEVDVTREAMKLDFYYNKNSYGTIKK